MFCWPGRRRPRAASSSEVVIYLVLFLYGLVIGEDSAANFVPVNTADNWLHLGLAVGMVGPGLLLGRGHAASTEH